jgi:N-acetyl sugar amidotransferase
MFLFGSSKTEIPASRPYQECVRCVMDTSDPFTTFDAEGNCSHCTDFLGRRGKYTTYRGRESDEQLERMFENVRRAGRGRKYDSVIGVSGGVDSSYLCYLAKEHGLRPLAVHMDNGWNSEKAVLNIRNINQQLGIDYESHVLDWEEFKDLQLAFLKASVPEAETPTDVAIPATLHLTAARLGIKYILSGSNLSTEGILPASWHYDIKDLKYFKHIHGTFGRLKLRKFPTFGYKKEAYYKLVRGIRMVYPLNHVNFVKDEAIEILRDKFGWKPYGGKHHESRYTKFIQSYYLYEKFGIDYRRATFSSLICSGTMSRSDAVDELRSKPYDAEEVDSDMQYIAKKLGVSREEFDQIVSLPPKWSWEYPNEREKLAFIYDTYRLIFRKEKLDRF